MTTTVVKTIGSTGDYSTIGAWSAAAPSNLTTTRSSTCGTGSTTSAVVLDAGASAVDSTYNGLVLTISGESRLITAYVGSTKTATVGVLNGSSATFSGAPSNGTAYVVDSVIWQGQCQVGSSWTNANSTISGSTSSSSCYKQLTTAAGASFRDDANKQTNPLRIDTSKGVYLTQNDGQGALVFGEANVHVSNLQIQSTYNAGSVTTVSNSGLGYDIIWDNCIIEGETGSGSAMCATRGATFRNCHFTGLTNFGSANAGFLSGQGGLGGGLFLYNCTFAVPSDRSQPMAQLVNSAEQITMENCVVMRCNTIQAGAGVLTSTTCATDIVSPPTGWTGSVPNSTATFVGVTAAARDYRLASGSALIDAGTTDSTNAPKDIIDTNRPQGSAYDIGCWEYNTGTIQINPGSAALAAASASNVIAGAVVIPHTAKPRSNRIVVPRNYGRIVPVVRKLPPELRV